MNWLNRAPALGAATLSVVALTLGGCGNVEGAADEGGVTLIPLGASVEVTGPASAIGVHWKEGIELAVDRANQGGGFQVGGKKYKWDLRLEDNQSKPDQAIAHYRAFVGDKVDFIIGPGLSTAFPPAYSSLGNERPLVLTPSLAAGKFVADGKGENLFITHLNDAGDEGRVAKVVEALVRDFDPSRVAILLPQDEPGERYTDLFSTHFEKAGAEIVYSEAFPSDTRDFGSYINALKGADPDLVVSGYLDSWLQPFLNQAAATGFTAPVFVGAPGSNVASLSQTKGELKNFVWSVTTRAVDNEDDPSVAEFRSAFEKKYGKTPDANTFWALSYYDPILMLTKALQEAGTVDDPAAVGKALQSVSKWDGAAMHGSFNPESHQLAYTPQIGVSSNGEISYTDAE